MYTELVFKSIRKLRENPTVLVPSLLFFCILAIGRSLMYKYGKFAELFQLADNVVKSNVKSAVISEAFQFDMFTSFFQTYWPQLVTSAAIFFASTFLIGVGAMVFEYVMVRNMVNEKPIKLWEDRQEKKKYFWSVVFIRLFVYVISFIVLALVGVLSILLYPSTGKMTTAVITIGAALGLITLALLALIKLGFMFRYAILIMEKSRNPVYVIKESLLYFRKNPAHTFYTWLTLLIVSIGIGIAGMILEYVNAELVKIGIPAIFNFVLPFIVILLGMIFQVWSDVFLFYCYKEKNLKGVVPLDRWRK